MYYVSTPEIDEPDRRDANDLAQLIVSRQFADWRELRFEQITSSRARRAMAQLASRVRDAFWQVPTRAAQLPYSARGADSQQAVEAEEVTASVRTTAKAEPPTHLVHPYQRGTLPP